MLSREDNEAIARVGPGAVIGTPDDLITQPDHTDRLSSPRPETLSRFQPSRAEVRRRSELLLDAQKLVPLGQTG